MKHFLKQVCYLIIAGIFILGCKGKDGAPGPKGDTGVQGNPGPNASVYNFSLTFDNSSTFKQYNGLNGKVGSNDVVLIYLATGNYGSQQYYSQLPLTATGITMYPEVGPTGIIFINAVYADGSAGSPYSSNTTLNFKAVIIKGAAGLRLASPGVDLSNYEEVKSYYNLKD